MPTRCGPRLAAILALAVLGACGADGDKAADPVVRALDAAGIHGVTYEQAFTVGTSVSLIGAKGTMDGAGRVAFGEVMANGIRAEGAGWAADGVILTRMVAEDRTAARIVIGKVRAAPGEKAWEVSYGDLQVEGYDGPLMGERVVASRLSRSGPAADGALTYAFAGLSGSAGMTAPAPFDTLAKGVGWDGSAVVRRERPDALSVEVREASSAFGTLSGSLSLAGEPSVLAQASSLRASELPFPSSWPEGTSLKEASLRLTLGGPRPVDADVPDPAGFADPAVKRVLERLSAENAKGRLGVDVRLAPPEPVPVRALEGIAKGGAATARLGITVGGPAPAQGGDRARR